MNVLYHRIPFLLELFFNGAFLILFSLDKSGTYPTFISKEYITGIMNALGDFVPFVILATLIIQYSIYKNVEDFFRKQIFSIIVFVPLMLLRGDYQFTYWLSTVHLFSSTLAVFDNKPKRINESRNKMNLGLIYRLNLQPAQVILLTFFVIILIGSFLLVLPISAAPGKEISFIDALFTSTSATCVNGLFTISLRDNFSLPGQIIVLALIQIGGLGIMTLSSSMTILMGRSLAMKEQIVMQDLLDINSFEGLMGIIRDIIKFTFFIELWGAIILTIGFFLEGLEFGTSIYYGFYHSISAFCNAGFALFNNSLEDYAFSPFIHGTISVLVIAGGLGFIVLKDIKEVIIRRKNFIHLTVHTKIVIVTNIVLLVAGTLFIFLNEFLHSFNGMNMWEQVQVAFFQSMTTRSAGFNTVPLTSFHPHTLYVMTLFMFIGASPGSTGGGIKTSTFAILIQSVRSTLRGRKNVEFFNRTVPSSQVVRAISVIIISLIIASGFIFLMMKIESDKAFLDIFFEVVSAFGTVGLSLGITSALSVWGKFVLVILMFIGRVGPLTLVLAIGQRKHKKGGTHYPDGRVMIG